jgi:hypothetical protein|tara:strand:- start:19 stop:210 length:192 start_codon:yes stop_codon:yes gene_type:complete
MCAPVAEEQPVISQQPSCVVTAPCTFVTLPLTLACHVCDGLPLHLVIDVPAPLVTLALSTFNG